MDNPCKHCDKANKDFEIGCEYGCDTPCQKARDFFAEAGKKLDEMISRVRRLLKEGAE